MPECVRVTQQELLWQEDRERGGATDRAAGRHRRFGAEEEDKESASTEPAGEEEEVVYEPDGAIDVRVHVGEVRQYFTEPKDRHKCSVEQPQEWFEIVKSNRILKEWTAHDQAAPPRGWIQDGWDGQDPAVVKDQYALALVLSVERGHE